MSAADSTVQPQLAQVPQKVLLIVDEHVEGGRRTHESNSRYSEALRGPHMSSLSVDAVAGLAHDDGPNADPIGLDVESAKRPIRHQARGLAHAEATAADGVPIHNRVVPLDITQCSVKSTLPPLNDDADGNARHDERPDHSCTPTSQVSLNAG